MNKVTPFLWFNDNAEAAAEFYVSVFANAKKIKELRVSEAGPGPVGSLLVVELEIEGQRVSLMNGGPAFKLNEAFSFVVNCETQEEVDDYWAKLTAEGGVESQCGWLKDKFGVSWQVTPVGIFDWVKTPGGMMAMMGMKKLDIAALKKAAKSER